MRAALVGLSIALVGSLWAPGADAPQLDGRFIATAYSQTGITASGQWTHRHVVAADPSVLPIGSRIKIKHAGRYSGEYVVADTGAKVQGRRLDLYLPSTPECKKFGVRRVSVRVLELGDGTHAAAKQADQTVKEDVKQDVAKGVVGNAATEHDWATKGAPVAKAVKEGGSPADAAPQVLGPSSAQSTGTAGAQNGTAPSNTSNTGTAPPK